jgi:hypothetical protein
METKHTPGPWITEIAGSDSPARVLAPNGCGQGCPCEVAGSVMPEDARLIAAAPDLAELLILALPAVEEAEQFNKPHGPKLSTRIRAAVAKAGVL